MIGRISGAVAYVDGQSAIIDAGGVGYRVFATAQALTPLTEGAAAEFWTYLSVRENALELFGFTTLLQLRLFELLLSVSGIGPRSALAIVGLAEPGVIAAAITKGNSAYLTTISGIGRKTAEKIVVELRDKVTDLAALAPAGGGAVDTDAIEALQSLGYSQHEAREALKLVGPEAETVPARVREALKYLSRS